jgi:hypothetical protein
MMDDDDDVVVYETHDVYSWISPLLPVFDFQFADGSVYVGTWKQGLYHGLG